MVNMNLWMLEASCNSLNRIESFIGYLRIRARLNRLNLSPRFHSCKTFQDDIDPCGASGRKPIGKVSDRCAVTTTRVFSNRLSFKRFMKRRKHRRSISLTKVKLYLSFLWNHPKFSITILLSFYFQLRAKMNLAESKYYNESLVERSKRNTRTLLAVSTDGLWPKWCVMVAFFRVFSQAYIWTFIWVEQINEQNFCNNRNNLRILHCAFKSNSWSQTRLSTRRILTLGSQSSAIA